MPSSLEGKTIVVTGGAKNLGAAVCRDLASLGPNLAIHYHSEQDEESARQLVADVKEHGGRALAFAGDLTVWEDVDRLFATAIDELGPLYGTVNTVGRVLSAPMVETGEDEFDQIFAVNAKACYLVMKRAAAGTQNGGRIVNVVTSLLAAFIPGYSAYAGAKSSNEQFVHALAKEVLDRSISVNNIGAGPMDTPFYWDAVHEGETEVVQSMAMENRLTKVEDVVPWVRFLLTDGYWASGQTFWINGGFATR